MTTFSQNNHTSQPLMRQDKYKIKKNQEINHQAIGELTKANYNVIVCVFRVHDPWIKKTYSSN